MTAMHLLSKQYYPIGSYNQTAPMYPAAHANLYHPLRTSLKNDLLLLHCGGVLNFAAVRYQQIITCKVKGLKGHSCR